MSTQEAAPSVEILLQYIKDLSVENPAPTRLLQENQADVDTRIEVDVQANTLGQDEHEIVVFLRIGIVKGEETLYMIEIQFAGLARIKNANEEILPLLLFIQCPYLLFPYMRMLVSVLTQESGFPPLVLHPIDFADLFRQRMEQVAAS